MALMVDEVRSLVATGQDRAIVEAYLRLVDSVRTAQSDEAAKDSAVEVFKKTLIANTQAYLSAQAAVTDVFKKLTKTSV